MSVAARNWANAARTGSRAAKSVLLVLADAAAEKVVKAGRGVAHQCTLSQETIGQRMEASSRTVQRALRALNLAGLVLSKFRADVRGYRCRATLYLNVNGEAVEQFAERCGITWRPSPATRQNDGKGSGCLSARMDEPTRQIGGASLNREMNRERARAKRQSTSTELPEGWTLPEEWRRHLRSRYEATDAQLDALARKFAHYYQREAQPRKRRHHDWLARLERWCMSDLPPKRAQQAELSMDNWLVHLSGWRDLGQWHPALGPAPDHPGCRVPEAAFEQLGLRRARPAA